MTTGFYHFQDDARNAGIQIDINGQLFHRDRAMVSVFDSGFVLGDGSVSVRVRKNYVIPDLPPIDTSDED